MTEVITEVTLKLTPFTSVDFRLAREIRCDLEDGGGIYRFRLAIEDYRIRDLVGSAPSGKVWRLVLDQRVPMAESRYDREYGAFERNLIHRIDRRVVWVEWDRRDDLGKFTYRNHMWGRLENILRVLPSVRFRFEAFDTWD